jgi:hypothetical protein
MSKITQQTVPILGETLGRVITEDELAQVSGARWVMDFFT